MDRGDVNMNECADKFNASYYDRDYFAEEKGKIFHRPDGSTDTFGYRNPQGEWLGCKPIVDAWKVLFNLDESNNNKMLDIGCGRGTFLTYAVDIGIDAIGFDYSDWAIANPYIRCDRSRIKKLDATIIPWPGYGDSSFDLVTVLDFMEHVFEDQINDIIKEVYRITKRYAFFLIATVGGGSGVNALIHEQGYILKKGEIVPVEYEAMAAAGHVTVCSREWWEERLIRSEHKWTIRRDLEDEFRKIVPADVLSNWKTIIILEKMK